MCCLLQTSFGDRGFQRPSMTRNFSSSDHWEHLVPIFQNHKSLEHHILLWTCFSLGHLDGYQHVEQELWKNKHSINPLKEVNFAYLWLLILVDDLECFHLLPNLLAIKFSLSEDKADTNMAPSLVEISEYRHCTNI